MNFSVLSFRLFKKKMAKQIGELLAMTLKMVVLRVSSGAQEQALLKDDLRQIRCHSLIEQS